MEHVSFEYGGKHFQLATPSRADHIPQVVSQEGTFYEVELLERIKELIAPSGHVLDVGANIGNHTLYFAGVLRRQVTAGTMRSPRLPLNPD